MSSLGQSLSEESETNRIPLCFQHSMKNCSYSGLFLLQNCFFLFCRVLIEIISILQLFINCYYLGLGERILREEKEMRDMKSRLLAIEAELQTLYRETGNESEVGNNY